MANLTFELTRDNDNVRFRELSIDVFSTFDLSEFSTENPLVFKTQTSIVIFPRTRRIKVKVRADASTAEGWQLKISFNGTAVPEQPIEKTADDSGRANFDGIVTWVNTLSSDLLQTLKPLITRNELKSLHKLIPKDDLTLLQFDIADRNKAAKARKSKQRPSRLK